uniref:ferredoxin--NADP(+) reductase n=1 Tax=Fibrocapsa japonica TaxID=94617 RepID=A0A7S2Y434_9STRA
MAELSFDEMRAKAQQAQDWLEFTPHWDHNQVSTNTFKANDPLEGQVVAVRRIVGPNAPGEVCHIVIDHGGKMPYIEGQSIGIIPPGVDSNNKPHRQRLYSIASTRYGDDLAGQTVSFSIRRALYIDKTTGKEDPSKAGVCSNFLCDSKPGTPIKMAGPTGKIMLLPEENPATDVIMVGTGTGVAPYRGFLRRLFAENNPASKAYKGQAWLFLGVANSDALLYDDFFQDILKKNPGHFRLDYALSREQKTKDGNKMYIQDKIAEYADEIFAKLDAGAHMYFCGLKGMMPGIEGMLETVCQARGIVWKDRLKQLKKKNQWHVEVY